MEKPRPRIHVTGVLISPAALEIPSPANLPVNLPLLGILCSDRFMLSRGGFREYREKSHGRVGIFRYCSLQQDIHPKPGFRY